jgi:hypothetical protein
MGEVLAPLETQQAQQVLDELAGRLNYQPIANPIGYCATLVQRMKSGRFTPEVGVRVAEARTARLQAVQQENARETALVTVGEASLDRLPEDLKMRVQRMRAGAEGRPLSAPEKSRESDALSATNSPDCNPP